MKYLITILLIFNITALNAATLKFNNGFESAMKGFRCVGNCPKVSTAKKKSGKYSGNFTLTRSMKVPNRTEALLDKAKGHFDFGKEYWISLDYWYEDWKNDKDAEVAPFQIHSTPGVWRLNCNLGKALSTGPFSMVSQNGKVRFNTYGKKTLWSGPIQMKKWLNITVHFKISSGSDGFIEAWKDGVKLGRVNGANQPKSDKCGNKMRAPYLKFGVYKWNWAAGRKATDSTRRQMFIDNVKVATGSNGYSLVSSASSKGKVTSKPKGKPKVTSKKQPSKTSNKKTNNNGKVTVIKITGSKPKGKPIKYNFNNKLFAHWDMTGNGRTIYDRSGNGYKGKLANGARITKGGVHFGGRNDYVSVGKFNVKGRALTISGWFNSENLKNCEHRDCRLISKATGVKEKNHTFMVSTVSVGSKTRLRFRLKTNEKVSTLIASSGNLQKNKWTHFAAVYDGHTMKLFKDGKQVGAMKKNGNITPSKAQVWIGGNPTKPSYRPWKGRIDELRIYNTALSKKQIVTLANE